MNTLICKKRLFLRDLLQPPPLYNGLYREGGGNPERYVVECEGCKKWFHPSCKRI